MKRHLLELAFAPLVLLACSKDAPAPIEPLPSTPPAAQAPAPTVNAAPVAASAPAPAAVTGPLHLGEPISAPTVALADVAAHPASYKGKPFVTTGVVTAVCQEMGCWMEMKDDKGLAHIRMHGHAFYVPKTSSGHHARVQATLVPTKTDEAAECDEEATKQMGHSVAKLELDATGIELD